MRHDIDSFNTPGLPELPVVGRSQKSPLAVSHSQRFGRTIVSPASKMKSFIDSDSTLPPLPSTISDDFFISLPNLPSMPGNAETKDVSLLKSRVSTYLPAVNQNPGNVGKTTAEHIDTATSPLLQSLANLRRPSRETRPTFEPVSLYLKQEKTSLKKAPKSLPDLPGTSKITDTQNVSPVKFTVQALTPPLLSSESLRDPSQNTKPTVEPLSSSLKQEKSSREAVKKNLPDLPKATSIADEKNVSALKYRATKQSPRAKLTNDNTSDITKITSEPVHTAPPPASQTTETTQPPPRATRTHPTFERVSSYLKREKISFKPEKKPLAQIHTPHACENIVSLSFGIALRPRERWSNWATERFFDLNLLTNFKVDIKYFVVYPYSRFHHYLQTTTMLVEILKYLLRSKKKTISPMLFVIPVLPPPLFAAIFETQYRGFLEAVRDASIFGERGSK